MNKKEINKKLAQILMKMPFLSEFTETEILVMLEREGIARIIKYLPNEKIIIEDMNDRRIICLIQGEVLVEKEGILLMSSNSQGDVFGEMSALDNSQRSASVTASKESTCFELNFELLKKLSAEKQANYWEKLSIGIARVLKKRLTDTTQELIKTKHLLNTFIKENNTIV